jgi:cold shock CspA family protein
MLSQTGETKWVYTDDQGAQQGPFTTAEVNGWFTAGYLQGDRLIKKDGEDGEFVPLSSVPELCAPAAAPPAAAQPQAGYVDPNAYGMQPQMMMPQQPVGPPAKVDPSQINIPEGKLLGEVKNWNDEKGFGFLIPTGGGDDIFAHRTDIITSGERPQLVRGMQCLYEVDNGRDGRPRAKDITNADGTPIPDGLGGGGGGMMGGGMMGGMGGMMGGGGGGGGVPGQKMMGEIKNWNDEKGFGFIVPQGGGDDVFCHRTDCVASCERPQLARGQAVMYEVGSGRDGRPRATGVTNVDGTPIGEGAPMGGGMGGGYGGGYGGQQMGGGYGGQQMGGGYGGQQRGGYGAPQAGGYGAPQAGGYGAPQQQQPQAGGNRYAPY